MENFSLLHWSHGTFSPFYWSHGTYIPLPTLHYITLHYRHFKCHLHLKWPVVHQQLHVIRNTAHRPSTQASYTASRVRPKRKISCAAAQIAATQIAATLTISFPRWRHMSLTSYWGQQLISWSPFSPPHWFHGAYFPFHTDLLGSSPSLLISKQPFSPTFWSHGAHFPFTKSWPDPRKLQ